MARASDARGVEHAGKEWGLTWCIVSLWFLWRAQSNSGKTAAMFAASGGHVDVLKAMQRGPSLLNLQSADGGTPAMSAAAHGFADVLQFIIDKKCDLDKQDEDGWTALMYAVCSHNVENVKRLVNAGAKVDIKNNDGETAAQLAGGKNKDEILRVLKMKAGSMKSIPEAGAGGKKKGCVIM